MTSEVKSDVKFELRTPDYPQIPILEAVDAVLIFEAARLRPQESRRSKLRPYSKSAAQKTPRYQFWRL